MSTKEYLEERIGDEYYYWGSGKFLLKLQQEVGRAHSL